ncbi:MAG TPA: tetratricopeptide repeat protein [Bacteroidales bacterium]|nr:tetratricopeptide repeat protein [Bacteroidales bacterium]
MDAKEKTGKRKQNTSKVKTIKSTSKNKKNNKWYWLALSVILLATLIIYFKAIKFDLLIWDDNLYINENSHIKALRWENIRLFFTSFYAGNYQPLTILMYAFEYQFAGESGFLYHLNNIILHIFNTFLVFILIKKIAPKNIPVALITAAFFAVHPMHVESVAWVAERKDVLYTFFFLLSLIMYAGYLKSKALKDILLTGLFFVLSCLSKSAAVILPLVMLLMDYKSDRKFSWKTIAEKIPFFAISLIFGLIAMQSQKEAMPDEQGIPFVTHFFVVFNSLITYIVKAFVPINLSAFYPYPKALNDALPVIYYLSLVFTGLLLFFVWYSRKWGKDVLFGFGFFLITIILVLQIITVGNATMADRYTYVPYIGIFYIIGKLYEYLAGKGKNYKNIIITAAVLVFIIFSSISYARVKKWENDETLFSDVIKKYPENPLPYNNRGCYYLKIAQNEHAENPEKQAVYFRNAYKDFNRITELDTGYYHIYYNRGLASFFLKDYNNAIRDFDREIRKNPDDDEAIFDRGNAKQQLKDYAGAIIDFDKAIALNPDAESIYFNRGNSKKELNDYEGALRDYDKAIALNPKLIKAYNNRSLLRCLLKDYEGTLADYDKMIELDPNDTTTIKNREVIRGLLNESKK